MSCAPTQDIVPAFRFSSFCLSQDRAHGKCRRSFTRIRDEHNSIPFSASRGHEVDQERIMTALHAKRDADAGLRRADRVHWPRRMNGGYLKTERVDESWIWWQVSTICYCLGSSNDPPIQ